MYLIPLTIHPEENWILRNKSINVGNCTTNHLEGTYTTLISCTVHWMAPHEIHSQSFCWRASFCQRKWNCNKPVLRYILSEVALGLPQLTPQSGTYKILLFMLLFNSHPVTQLMNGFTSGVWWLTLAYEENNVWILHTDCWFSSSVCATSSAWKWSLVSFLLLPAAAVKPPSTAGQVLQIERLSLSQSNRCAIKDQTGKKLPFVFYSGTCFISMRFIYAGVGW